MTLSIYNVVSVLLIAYALGILTQILIYNRVRASVFSQAPRPPAVSAYRVVEIDSKVIGQPAFEVLMEAYDNYKDDPDSWVAQSRLHHALSAHIPNDELRTYRISLADVSCYSLTVHLHKRA